MMHSFKPLALLWAAGALAAALPATVLAQPHGHGSRAGWDRGHARHAPAPYYRGAPRYYGPRYYSAPYPVYLPPVFAPGFYGYPVYEAPPPVVVQRYYIEPPAPRVHRERSYAQVQPAPRPPPVPAAPTPRRLERYTLSATELFEFDKAVLRLPQPKLDEIAAVLVRNRDIAKVEITGYTDRLGSEAYNLKLSQRRAEAVKAYLAGKGVDASRLHTVGRGEANPVVQCSDANQDSLVKCLEPNRRVEVEEITVEIRR